MERKKLSSVFINLFGIGDFGFTAMTMIESYFFVAFMYTLGMDSFQVGLIGGITAAFDIAWVFVAAALVQKLNFRWGKLRSWVLIAPPIVAVFFIMNYWGFSGPDTVGQLIITIGFIVSHLLWNCSYAANLTMVQAYTDDNNERALLGSRKAVWGTASNIVFSMVGLTLFYQFAGNPVTQASSYTVFAGLMAVLMVVLYFALFVLTKPYEGDTRGKTQEGGENITTGQALKVVLKNSQLWIIMLSLFGMMVPAFMILGVLAFFYEGFFNNPAAMATYGLFSAIAGVVGAMLAPIVSKQIGKKMTFVFGLFAYAACLIIVWLFLYNDETLFLVGMSVGAGFAAFGSAMSFAMFADCVTYSVWKQGVAAAEFTMGMYSFPIKVAVLATRVFIPAVLAMANHALDPVTNAVVKSDTALEAYRNLATIYPAVVVIIAAVICLVGFKLTDKKLDEMNTDLANGTAPFMKKAS